MSKKIYTKMACDEMLENNDSTISCFAEEQIDKKDSKNLSNEKNNTACSMLYTNNKKEEELKANDNTSNGWNIINYDNKRNIRGKNSEMRPIKEDTKTLAKFAKIPCRNYPGCKWKKDCWYLHKGEIECLPNELNSSKCENETLEDFERKLASYRGHGPKKRGKETSFVEIKPVITGKCTIDAILNMLRTTDFIETMTSHTLCQHTEFCMKCILRSALCKAKLGSGKKNTVEVAEIKNNLEMFYNEKDVTHDFEEGKQDRVEMLSLKIILDTMLSESAYIDQLHLPVLCTKCHRDMNKNTNGYFILQNTNIKDMGEAFAQSISNLIESHHTKCIECETGSFEYGKFPITLMMMMQRAT